MTATTLIDNVLMARWLNIPITVVERLPFEKREKYRITMKAILDSKPELLMGFGFGSS